MSSGSVHAMNDGESVRDPRDFSLPLLKRLPLAIRDSVALGLAVCIAVLDYLTPNYIFLTGFYFFPLFMAIWFGRKPVAVLVLLIAVAMAFHESWRLLPESASWWLHAVEYLSFVSIFLVVAGLLWYSKRVLEVMSRDRKSLERAASVFHHAREGILITDPDGLIIDANDTFTRITGYSRQEVIGQHPRILKSGYQSADFYREMWAQIGSEGSWSGEVLNRRKTGEIYAELLTISAVKHKDGKTQAYIALFSDITPIHRHKQELERIAHYDPLTGLPNRTLLGDRLQQALSQGLRHRQGVAVIYLDLDGFKAINDSHGHAVGDALLVEVSMRMRNALRDEDTLARIGGDEFIAVLSHVSDAKSCESFLQRLLLAASEPVSIESEILNVSASIGVAFSPQDGEHAELLLRHADQAMYAAKQSGKNRYQFFDAAQNTQARQRNEMLGRIRQALLHNEFELFFQPKVNMRQGRVVGVETLIRWRHPTDGLLPPAAFLPYLEKDPLNEQLGDWVLEHAVAQMAAWHDHGLYMPVSVNISAGQLQQADFTSKLQALFERHPMLDPWDLTLEILETHALDDVDSATRIMKECLALGVRFSLDDFGTGYSSLAYLSQLEADEIKIDQGFVRNMLEHSGDMAIVEGVLSLARVFGRKVVAEGVESEAHGLSLLRLGCELAQGYGIAKPMPAASLLTWLNTWQPFKSWLKEGKSCVKASSSGVSNVRLLGASFVSTEAR